MKRRWRWAVITIGGRVYANGEGRIRFSLLESLFIISNPLSGGYRGSVHKLPLSSKVHPTPPIFHRASELWEDK